MSVYVRVRVRVRTFSWSGQNGIHSPSTYLFHSPFSHKSFDCVTFYSLCFVNEHINMYAPHYYTHINDTQQSWNPILVFGVHSLLSVLPLVIQMRGRERERKRERLKVATLRMWIRLHQPYKQQNIKTTKTCVMVAPLRMKHSSGHIEKLESKKETVK